MTALLLAAILAADHQYIIPIIGGSSGAASTHFAQATAWNPTARPATVRRTGLYPADCILPREWTIPPRSREVIVFSSTFPCRGMAAVTISSNEPLYVTGTIHSFTLVPQVLADVQHYDVPTEWIEGGVDAVAEGVAHEFGGRANLLVVNPNPTPLRIDVHIERPEYRASREASFEVPPSTIRMLPLPAVEEPNPSPFPRVVSGQHDYVIRGNQRFWAGVSSVDTDGGNTFRKAIALEP